MKTTTKRVSILLACIMLSLSNVFAFNSNSDDTSDNQESGDQRMKIRLVFNSVNTFTRKISVIADESATDGFDSEFDSALENVQEDDMYWLIDLGKYIDQGISEINEETVLQLGINTNEDGINSIAIDKLDNIPSDMKIFVHDKALGVYHSIKDGAYQVSLNAGAYLNRFEVVFMQPDTLSTTEFHKEDKSLDIRFDMQTDQIKIMNNSNLKIEGVQVYSILGQSVHTSNATHTNNELQINASHMSTGAYVVIVTAENGINSKKILVN
ncbi:T9SS type A sorting domain-containing protein [Psychroserpens algicola]|uniref:T9SS type A sorting domain-containing protein n=1 Tax=Psychroserpens algicola TaxID=1719034 RepID=A0ABT0H547_9FLAO|nr:T9SS type A sorting domain-containing protein [Psychroserpens algicola]MCK8479486.1 T9SS type A sorting domain-containing protein [Psychroserpens algicola]